MIICDGLNHMYIYMLQPVIICMMSIWCLTTVFYCKAFQAGRWWKPFKEAEDLFLVSVLLPYWHCTLLLCF
uniref:XK-related protein n=1 Tax=Ascaris lumbricoides TaxID=6252 RepID=A0A0M3IJK9_ASCLU